jgi:putative transposase
MVLSSLGRAPLLKWETIRTALSRMTAFSVATDFLPPTGGPSWLILLGQAKDSLWSMDLFEVESIHLRTHWILVVMDQFTRTIVGFGLQVGPVDGVALCRMFNQAIADQGLPARLSLDHDPLFAFRRWQANLRILEIEAIQTVPYAPVSHPFIQRLIGTLRPRVFGPLFFLEPA